MGAGTGDTASSEHGRVREAYLQWYRQSYPLDTLSAYRQYDQALQDHRTRSRQQARAQGIDMFNDLIRLLLIPTPHPASLPLEDIVAAPKGHPTDLNPFFSLPDSWTDPHRQDPSITASPHSLSQSLTAMERIADRLRRVTGLEQNVFTAVLHRQDSRCLVRRLLAYLFCSDNTDHPRLFGPFSIFIKHSTVYRDCPDVGDAVDQRPKVFASASEDLKQQQTCIKALLDVLRLTPTELCYINSIPAVPRPDLDGEIVANMGGFSLLTAYGIRYSSQGSKTIAWASPYASQYSQHGFSGWYDLSSELGSILDMTVAQTVTSPEDPEAERVLQVTRDMMETMGLGDISALATLQAAKRDVGTGSDYSRLKIAVYRELYSPLIAESRAIDPFTATLPPDSTTFSNSWQRFMTKVTDLQLHGADLRAKFGNTWWRPSDLLLLDFIWLLFGDFDGLQVILLRVLPGKSDEALSRLLATYPNHFRRMTRSAQSLADFIRQYNLGESYDIILSDPDLASRVLRCEHLLSPSSRPASPMTGIE